MSVSVKMVGGNVKQAGLSLTSKLAYGCGDAGCNVVWRSEEHTSELQSQR